MRSVTNVNFAVTTHCSRACPNCCCAVPWHKHEHFDFDYFQQAADYLYGIEQITVTGGEPTSHPKFGLIAETFRSLFGCKRLLLETNGFALEAYAGCIPDFDEVRLTVYDGEDHAWLKAPNVTRQHVHHVDRRLRHPGTCHRGISETVSYWKGLLYPCCVAAGVDGGVGIPLTADWRERIQCVQPPCRNCWFAGEMMPDLRYAFPHACPTLPGGVLADKDFDPNCGYIAQDEANTLYRMACEYPGLWLEIGTHTGWSAAHIALAGNNVITLDPALGDDPRMMARARENLERAGVKDLVAIEPIKSDEWFGRHPVQSSFAGVFIDGNHDSPHPANDAKNAIRSLQRRGCIVFHDGAGQPIKDGVELCRAAGFSVEVHHTQQSLTVCRREQ